MNIDSLMFEMNELNNPTKEKIAFSIEGTVYFNVLSDDIFVELQKATLYNTISDLVFDTINNNFVDSDDAAKIVKLNKQNRYSLTTSRISASDFSSYKWVRIYFYDYDNENNYVDAFFVPESFYEAAKQSNKITRMKKW